MATSTLSEYEQLSIEKLTKSYYDGRWTNHGLTQLAIVIIDDLLNAKRVSEYAMLNNISPQGARKFRSPFIVCGYKLIPNNL